MKIWEFINGICHLIAGLLHFVHGHGGELVTVENGIAIAFVGIGISLLRKLLFGDGNNNQSKN